jgi:translation initiation factor IF-2
MNMQEGRKFKEYEEIYKKRRVRKDIIILVEKRDRESVVQKLYRLDIIIVNA